MTRLSSPGTLLERMQLGRPVLEVANRFETNARKVQGCKFSTLIGRSLDGNRVRFNFSHDHPHHQYQIHDLSTSKTTAVTHQQSTNCSIAFDASLMEFFAAAHVPLS